MSALDIHRTASSWLGVPFVHQGASRHGCDCAGLVAGVLAEHGVRLRLPPYGPGGQGVRIAEVAASLGLHPLLAQAARAGDLVAWQAAPGIVHLGILGPDHIIHASERAGRVIRTALRPALPPFTAAWELTSLEPAPHV